MNKKLGVSKKTEKLIKPRKQKKNWKNRTVKKNRLKFWKNRPIWFYKPEIKKPNRTKTEKTRKNRVKPEKPSQTRKTEPSRFEPVFFLKPNRNRSVWTGFGFFKKNSVLLLFLIKIEPNRKSSPIQKVSISQSALMSSSRI
jgi:hypothetical protein